MTQVARLLNLIPTDISVLEGDLGVRIQPRALEEVQLVVQAANASKMPLYPWQQQTQRLDHGVYLDLTLMNRVKKYRASEFLIAVEAGMTMGQLADLTAENQQRFPLRYPATRTVLEVLGESTLSLSATQNGSLKHWVVGLETITGDGEYIHYGGELVKNVTGYDLNKLFCGSGHRYGIITSAILKLAPQAEMTRSFLFHIDDLSQALTIWQTLGATLSTAEMLTMFKTKTTFGWQILVNLNGYTSLVETESELVRNTVAMLKADLQELFLAPKALEQWIGRLDWTAPVEPDALVVKVALPQSVLKTLPQLWMESPWFKAADVLMPYDTHLMHLRWISVNRPALSELQGFQATIESLGGFVQIVRTPADVVMDLPQPDPSGVLALWRQRLKAQYDPAGVLGGPFYHETVLSGAAL